LTAFQTGTKALQSIQEKSMSLEHVENVMDALEDVMADTRDVEQAFVEGQERAFGPSMTEEDRLQLETELDGLLADEKAEETHRLDRDLEELERVDRLERQLANLSVPSNIEYNESKEPTVKKIVVE
jgi:hypothetical protein